MHSHYRVVRTSMLWGPDAICEPEFDKSLVGQVP